MIKPVLDYILGEEIKPDSGAVTGQEVGDHWQKYKVLAVGQGRHSEHTGELIPMPCAEGDVVYVQKHAEADTPPELIKLNQALFMASRVMGVENE